MQRNTNPFTELTERVSRGDGDARVQLRQQLEPELVRIVRLTLAGDGTSPVARRIFAEARRLASETDEESETSREEVVREVAHSLCNLILAQCSCPGNDFTMKETVCAL